MYEVYVNMAQKSSKVIYNECNENVENYDVDVHTINFFFFFLLYISLLPVFLHIFAFI